MKIANLYFSNTRRRGAEWSVMAVNPTRLVSLWIGQLYHTPSQGPRILATMADSALKSNLTEAMKDAMRAKDKFRLGAIRLALSEIKRVEVDERIDLDDERVTAILDKMVKQRRESIKQFEAADRHELAAVEKDEIVVLQEFLPQPLTEDESEAIIKAAIAESGAATMQEMGKVMAIVRPQVVGRVDMGAVSAKIKALLA